MVSGLTGRHTSVPFAYAVATGEQPSACAPLKAGSSPLSRPASMNSWKPRATLVNSEPEAIGAEVEARFVQLRERALEALDLIEGVPPELAATVRGIEQPGLLADLVTGLLPLAPAEKQEVLETVFLPERLDRVLGRLAYRLEVLRMSADIGRRTRETMERIRTAMGLDPTAYRLDERLKELSFGDWEGFTTAEIKAVDRESIRERSRQKWGFIPPGADAESYEILSWRIGAWLASVKQQTVAVAHGGVVRSLFRIVGNIDEDEAANMPIHQDRIVGIDTDKNEIRWL